MKRLGLCLGLLFAAGWCRADQKIVRPTIGIADEGIFIGRVSTLNCVGSGINCTQSGSVGNINITASGSGGGGGGGNFRLLINGVDSGINISSTNIIPGNGLGLQVYSSSFTLSIPSTASLQIYSLATGTSAPQAIIHIATSNGFVGNMLLLSTGDTQLYMFNPASYSVLVSSVLINKGLSSATNPQTFVSIGSTYMVPVPLAVGSGGKSNSSGLSPLVFLHQSGSVYLVLQEDSSNVDVFLGNNLAAQFGSQTNHPVNIYSNNTSRVTIPAAGGLVVKSTDLVVAPGGLVGIGTTTPRAMLHLALVNGPADSRFIRCSTGDTIIFEVGVTSMIAPSTTSFGGIPYVWPSAQASGVKILSNDGLGNLSWATDATGGGGGGGSALSIGGYLNNIFQVAFTTLNFSGDAQVFVQGSSLTIRIDFTTMTVAIGTTGIFTAYLNTAISTTGAFASGLNVAIGTTGVELINYKNSNNASTNTLTNLIFALSSETVSGGGGGVKTLYLYNNFDAGNVYQQMFSTPSTALEKSRTVSVAAADGLLMLSSHSTVSTGLGEDVINIPAGAWQFMIFGKIDSLVGQTDLVIDIATMSKLGAGIWNIVSATISNINATSTSPFVAEALLTSDVAVSTDDRVLVRIYAKTTSALARTVTISYQGVTYASRIGTTIERQPTFLSLDDTQNSYVGQSGKFVQINPGETALIFNTIDTMTAITAISTTGASLQSSSNTLFSAITSTYNAAASTGLALTNYQTAVAISTGIQLSQHYVIVSTNLAPTITITNLISSSLTAHTEVEFPVSGAAVAPNVSSPCMPTVQIFESATNRINYDAIGFSSFTGVNYGHFNHSLPKGWNASTVTFHVTWTSTSAGTAGQTVVWGMQALAVTSGTTIDSPYGSTRTVTSSVLGTANQLFRSTEALAMTVGGSPAQGNETQVQWNIFRDKTDARDNFQGQANLVEIRIRYTKEYLTDK